MPLPILPAQGDPFAPIPYASPAGWENDPIVGSTEEDFLPSKSFDEEFPNWIGRPISTPFADLSGGQDYVDLVQKGTEGRRGIFEEMFDPEAKDVPLGGYAEIPYMFGVAATAKKIRNEEDVSDQELLDLNKYIEFQRRKAGSTWGAKLVDLVQGTVAFGAEMGATALLAGFLWWEPTTDAAGGAIATGAATKLAASKAARKATEIFMRKQFGRTTSKIVAKGLKSVAKSAAFHGAIADSVGKATAKAIAKKTGSAAVAKWVGKIAEVATFTETGALLNQVLHPERTVSSIAERRIRNNIADGDESVAASVAKGIMDMNAEYASEFSGKYFGQLARKLLPPRLIEHMGESALYKLVGLNTAQSTMRGAARVLNAMGVNQVWEEMAEERAGDFMRGLFGVQGDAGLLNAIKESWPTGEQFSLEAVGFSIMPIMGNAVNRITGGVSSGEMAENIAMLNNMSREKGKHAATEEGIRKQAEDFGAKWTEENTPWYVDSGFSYLEKVFGRERRGSLDSIARRAGVNLSRIFENAAMGPSWNKLSRGERKAYAEKHEGLSQKELQAQFEKDRRAKAVNSEAGVDAIADVLRRWQEVQVTGIKTDADRELFNAGVTAGDIVYKRHGGQWSYRATREALDNDAYMKLVKQTHIDHIVDIDKFDSHRVRDLLGIDFGKSFDALPMNEKKEWQESWNLSDLKATKERYERFKELYDTGELDDVSIHEVLPAVTIGTEADFKANGYTIDNTTAVYDTKDGEKRYVMHLGANTSEDGKDVDLSIHARDWSAVEDILEAKNKQYNGKDLFPAANEWMDSLKKELEDKGADRTEADEITLKMLETKGDRFEFFMKSYMLNRMGMDAVADDYSRRLARDMPESLDTDMFSIVGEKLIAALARPYTALKAPTRGERHQKVLDLTSERGAGRTAQARELTTEAKDIALVNELDNALGKDMRKTENRTKVQDILQEMDRTGTTFALEQLDFESILSDADKQVVLDYVDKSDIPDKDYQPYLNKMRDFLVEANMPLEGIGFAVGEMQKLFEDYDSPDQIEAQLESQLELPNINAKAAIEQIKHNLEQKKQIRKKTRDDIANIKAFMEDPRARAGQEEDYPTPEFAKPVYSAEEIATVIPGWMKHENLNMLRDDFINDYDGMKTVDVVDRAFEDLGTDGLKDVSEEGESLFDLEARMTEDIDSMAGKLAKGTARYQPGKRPKSRTAVQPGRRVRGGSTLLAARTPSSKPYSPVKALPFEVNPDDVQAGSVDSQEQDAIDEQFGEDAPSVVASRIDATRIERDEEGLEKDPRKFWTMKPLTDEALSKQITYVAPVGSGALNRFAADLKESGYTKQAHIDHKVMFIPSNADYAKKDKNGKVIVPAIDGWLRSISQKKLDNGSPGMLQRDPRSVPHLARARRALKDPQKNIEGAILVLDYGETSTENQQGLPMGRAMHVALTGDYPLGKIYPVWSKAKVEHGTHWLRDFDVDEVLGEIDDDPGVVHDFLGDVGETAPLPGLPETWEDVSQDTQERLAKEWNINAEDIKSLESRYNQEKSKLKDKATKRQLVPAAYHAAVFPITSQRLETIKTDAAINRLAGQLHDWIRRNKIRRLMIGGLDQIETTGTFEKQGGGGVGVKIVGDSDPKTENDWNLDLMKRVVRESFTQNPEALKKLIDTGTAPITHWQDKGVWKKEFPRILTELREELRGETELKEADKPINVWYGSNEHADLSNLSDRPFVDKDDRKYINPEHAYQSWKSGEFDETTYDKYNAPAETLIYDQTKVISPKWLPTFARVFHKAISTETTKARADVEAAQPAELDKATIAGLEESLKADKSTFSLAQYESARNYIMSMVPAKARRLRANDTSKLRQYMDPDSVRFFKADIVGLINSLTLKSRRAEAHRVFGDMLEAVNKGTAAPVEPVVPAPVEADIGAFDYERELTTKSLEAMDSIFSERSPLFMSGDVALHRILLEQDRNRRAEVQAAMARSDRWRKQVGLLEPDKTLPEGHSLKAKELLASTGARLDGSKRIPLKVEESNWRKEDGEWVRKIDVTWSGNTPEQAAKAWDDYIKTNNLNMPTAEALYKDMRTEYEAARNKANDILQQLSENEWIKYVEDYVNHNYRSKDPRTKEEAVRKIREDTKHSKQRRIPTYEEAAQKHALLPVTMDATKLYDTWNQTVWAAARNKSILSLASLLQDADGSPVMIPIRTGTVPPGVDPVISDKILRRAGRQLAEYLENDFNESADPAVEIRRLTDDLDLAKHDLVRMDSPYTSSIDYFLVRKGNAHKIMKTVLSHGRMDNKVVNGLEHMNSWSKTMMLAFSLFFPFALTESLISTFGLSMDNPVMHPVRTKNTLKQLIKDMRTNPELWDEAVRAGLTLDTGVPTDPRGVVDKDIQNAIDHYEAKDSYDSKVFLPGLKAVQWYKGKVDKWLWYEYLPAIKLHGYNFVYDKWQEENPNAEEDVTATAREDIARYINDAFGGQDFNEYVWATPFARQALHLLAFAPNWCCDDKTRAFTKTGFKYHHELKIDDEILIFDPKTKKNRWGNLNDMYVKEDYSGDMVRIKNYNRKIMITPEHTCIVVHDKNRKSSVVKAKDINTHHLIPRCAPMDLATKKTVDDRLVRIVGWMVTDGSYAYTSWRTNASGEKIRSRFGRICQSKASGTSDLNTLGLKYYTESIEQGLRSNFKSNGPVNRYYVSTGIIKEMISLGVRDNNLSWDFLSRLTRRQLKLLYKTMMLGDGTGHNRFCGKEHEVFNMTMLQTMLGKPTMFLQQEEHCWRTRVIDSKFISCWGHHNNKETVHYEGTIWCPSVDTGFWVAEREGLIFITGNTISAANVAGATRLPGIGGKFHASNLSPIAKSNMLRRYWPAMTAIVLMGLPNMLQTLMYMAFGDPDDGDKPFTFMNEPGKKTHVDFTPILRKMNLYGGDTGKRRTYMRWGKQAYEVFDGWYKNPFDMLLRKSSSIVREGFEQVTGHNTAMWELPFNDEGMLGIVRAEGSFWKSRLGYTAQKFVPISALSMAQGRPSTFIAPASQGVSIGSATYSMSKVLDAYVDRQALPKAYRPHDLQVLVSDLVDAAENNGVNADEAFKRAKAKVVGKHYRRFFKALDAGKHAQMEDEAEKLIMLGKGLENFNRSIKLRLDSLNREYGADLQYKVKEAYGRAQER